MQRVEPGISRHLHHSSYPRRRVSSTPRPIGSIAAVSGILGRPPSRAMTAVDKHTSAFPRQVSPGLCQSSRPKERAQGMPGACCTRGLVCNKCASKTHTSIQVQSEHSGIPCTIVLQLIPCSPRRRIRLVTVIGGLKVLRARLGSQHLRRLDTSNGCQDHTALLYATRLRQEASPGLVPIRRSVGEFGSSAVRLPRRSIAHESKDSPCDAVRARRCRVHRIPSQRP
jgi:hypothetical protein